MRSSQRIRQRLAALGMLGLPLVTFPLLSAVQGDIFGFPAAYVYLFGVWLGLIGLAALVAEEPHP